MKKELKITIEQDYYDTLEMYKKSHNIKSNSVAIEKLLHDNQSVNQSTQPFECFNITNRRYLGSKTKILNFIENSISKHIPQYESFVDIFAGTGAVASYFNHQDKRIISNDLLFSNYVSHYAFLSDEYFNPSTIEELLIHLNSIKPKDNYFAKNFGDKFFSYEVAKKIGTIREEIEKLSNSINLREKYILITSLIYSVDKIANTCGHYDAYRMNTKMPESFTMKQLDIYHNKNIGNIILNGDSNKVIEEIGKIDILYLDPPYNSRQYISSYHVIENLAKWDKPKVEGKASKMVDRSKYNSQYCTKSAIQSFEDLINKAEAKYIILSYSDMATKGNDRSNARMIDKDIIEVLSKKGSLIIESIDHKPFSTGKTNLETHKERLFICKTF